MQFLVYILQWPAVKSMRREKQSEIQILLESSLKIKIAVRKEINQDKKP